MGFELKNSADDSILQSENTSAEDFYTDKLQSIPLNHVFPFGQIKGTKWQFNGIRILYTDWRFKERAEMDWRGDYEIVSMIFNLKGNMLLQNVMTGNQYEFCDNQHNIIFGREAEGKFKAENLHMKSFTIQFEKEAFFKISNEGNDVLKRFAENVSKGNSVALSQSNLNISLEMQNCINAVIHCKYSDSLKQMFLLSKIIELLVLQAESYNQILVPKPVYVKKEYDKERIIFARDYLLKNLVTPPSLSNLSRIAGINEYKLKRGFKEIFGTTTFGYLSDTRLELAKTALLENQKSVAEIAFELGYSSPQHFTSAFKKKFGVSPRQLK